MVARAPASACSPPRRSRKGAFIIEYKGRRITNAQAEKLEARGSRYMYELNSRWTLDGSSRRNIARYANHSCRPNAESDVVRRQVILRAIKNIKPGDEITYDYGPDYFEIFLEPAGCKCDKCRAKRRKQRQLRWLGSSARPGGESAWQRHAQAGPARFAFRTRDGMPM